MSFKAKDFYGNSISEPWGNDSFQAWSYASVGNTTPAAVHDEGNGSYTVVSEALEFGGTEFLFVERNGLGIPGSPFEVSCHGTYVVEVPRTPSPDTRSLYSHQAMERGEMGGTFTYLQLEQERAGRDRRERNAPRGGNHRFGREGVEGGVLGRRLVMSGGCMQGKGVVIQHFFLRLPVEECWNSREPTRPPAQGLAAFPKGHYALPVCVMFFFHFFCKTMYL